MGQKIKYFLLSEYWLVVFTALFFGVVIFTTWRDLPERYLFLDQIFHFVGGFWVAELFLLLFQRYPELRRYGSFLENKWLTIALALAVAALAGVLWEFYELWTHTIGDVFDTMNDLLMDLIGGATSALIIVSL